MADRAAMAPRSEAGHPVASMNDCVLHPGGSRRHRASARPARVGALQALRLVALTAALLAGSAASAAPPAEAPAAAPDDAAADLTRRLDALAAALSERESEIASLRARLRAAKEAEDRRELEEELRDREAERKRQTARFREVALGVDLEEAERSDGAAFDWSTELKELLGPLVGELRRATGRPRRMHQLEREVDGLRARTVLVAEAIGNLDRLEAGGASEALRLRLESVEAGLRAEADQLQADQGLAEAELARLQSEQTSVSDTVGRLAQLFFRSRGRNLVLALAAFAATWLAFRVLYVSAARLAPRRPRRRSVAVRLLDLLYRIAGGVAATLAGLFVLYESGDWLLLSLASLFLFGLAWASKTAIPRFWRQAMLLLNVGPVREGERILYEGVPYRVERLGFHTFLANPDLAGGRLRLPIGVIEGQVSRPAQEDEPWFPTRRGDWVLLGDGKHGRVTVQTPEIVTVVELGGARRNFRSQDFFSAPPTVLSAGFRLWVPFGVDYRHQALATREIPRQLELRIREALASGGYLEHLSRLSVEFQGAGASSLDLVALLDMLGAAAPDYQRIVRLVQRTCVESCTENGWGIPFTQLTLHVAREAEAPRGGPAQRSPDVID